MDCLKDIARDLCSTRTSIPILNEIQRNVFWKVASKRINEVVKSTLETISKTHNPSNVKNVLSSRVRTRGVILLTMLSNGEIQDFSHLDIFLSILKETKLNKWIKPGFVALIKMQQLQKVSFESSILSGESKTAEFYKEVADTILWEINSANLTRELKNEASLEVGLALSNIREIYRKGTKDKDTNCCALLIKILEKTRELIKYYEIVNPLITSLYKESQVIKDENLRDCFTNYVDTYLTKNHILFLEQKIINLDEHIKELSEHFSRIIESLIFLEVFYPAYTNDLVIFPISSEQKAMIRKDFDTDIEKMKDMFLSAGDRYEADKVIQNMCRRFEKIKQRINETLLEKFHNRLLEKTPQNQKQYLMKFNLLIMELLEKHKLYKRIANETITVKNMLEELDEIEDEFIIRCEMIVNSKK